MHAQIRLVRAIAQHGFAIAHDRKGIGQIDINRFLEDRTNHAFKDGANFGFPEEGRFAVNLRELRLTVGAQVFVAKALGDLVVAVKSRHHQHLLEQLRRLRQRKELPVMHPRRHQVVTRTFRRGLGQHRCFNVDESLCIEVAAYRHRDSIAQHHVLLHLRPAQINDTMRQAHRLGQIVFIELERRRQ